MKYMGFMNSSYRGRKHEGTCGMPDYVKLNAWDVGVRIEPDNAARQDTLRVYLTGGSHDTGGRTEVGRAVSTEAGPRWEPAGPPKPSRTPVTVKTAGHPLDRYALPVVAAIPLASHMNNPEPGEYICVVVTGRWSSGEPVFGTVHAIREGDDWVTDSRAYDMSVLGSKPGPWSQTKAVMEMVQMAGCQLPACTRKHI